MAGAGAGAGAGVKKRENVEPESEPKIIILAPQYWYTYVHGTVYAVEYTAQNSQSSL